MIIDKTMKAVCLIDILFSHSQTPHHRHREYQKTQTSERRPNNNTAK